jgi:transcriptional regulator with XRE-family HTH domain
MRRTKGSSRGEFHFIDVHVGKQLRRRRLDLGLSQTQLAKAAGVSYQLIQKFEDAVNRIAPGRLFRLARALGVPVTWFFEGLPPIETRRSPTTLSELGLDHGD